MDERQCCLRLGGVVRVVYRSRLPGDAHGGHVGLPACTATCGTSGITLAGVDRHPSGVQADRAATGISRRLLVILRRRSCLGVLFFNEAPGLQCRIRPCAGANRAIAWVIAPAGIAAGRGIPAVHARKFLDRAYRHLGDRSGLRSLAWLVVSLC